MSAYSSQHWPENGHGYFEAEPYRGEGSRGANRGFYRQQEPRWFHGEGSPHAPYGGGSSREYGRHSEVTDWGHYPGPPPLENGYREREEYPLQHRGDPPIHARNSPRPNPYADLEDPRLRREVHPSSWNRGSPRPPGPFHHSPTIDAGRSDLSPHAVHDSHQSPRPPQPLHRALPPYGDLSKLRLEGHRFREGGGSNFGKRPPLESGRSYPPSSSGQYNGGAYWEGPEGRYPLQRRHSPHRILLPTPSASQEDRLPENHHGYQRASASSMSPCSNSPDVESPRYSRTAPIGALEVRDQQRHAPLPHRDKGQLEPKGAERELPCPGGLPAKREGLPSYSMRAEEKRTAPYSHGVKDSERRYGPPQLLLEGGYQLEKDRIDGLVPHHQSASLDSLGSGRTDSMRDPRLQRNKNIAQLATSPSAVQVLKEHSYCLERVSYETQPNLQQKQSGSCFLTKMPKGGSQKAKPASQKVVATPSEKPQACSVPLSRNQSEQQSNNESVHEAHTRGTAPAQESCPAKEVQVQIKKEPEVPQIEEKTMPSEQLDIARRPDRKENQTPASDSNHLEASDLRVQQLPSRSTVEDLHEVDECYPLSPKFSMEGFNLDLDTEPDSSGEEEGGLGPGSFMVHVPNSVLPNHWAITPPDESRPRVSRIGHDEANSEPLKLSLKKYQANQFQLRNGRVLPARTLAFYASQKSPSTSGRSSPEIHHRRRSRRLAALATTGEGEESCILASLSDDNSESGGEDGSWNKHEPPDSDESYHLPYTVAEDCNHPPTEVEFGKVSIAGRDKDQVEDPAQQASIGKRKRARRGRKSRFFMYGKNKKKRAAPPAQEDSLDTQASSIELEHSPSRAQNHRRNYQDFRPVILETRSRGESVTLMRRKMMAEEMEQHELERVQTARQLHEEYAEYCDIRVEEMDDNGSVYSATSSSLASRDVDSTTTTKSSILEEFSPELIARCKKITTAKSSGDTPLHKVCRTGKYDMARYLLLVECVSVNAQDHAGWTSLHEACSSCNLRIAELLLQCGADANLSATDGTRPIHDAIETGSLDLVQLLIQYGADPQAEFGEKTPVEFARSQGQNEIFRYLKELVKETQKSRPIPPSSPVREKATPTRQSRKQKLTRQAEGITVLFPVDGYSSEDPSFGAELDYPLFYVAPVVELSEDPHLPVYNLAVAPGSSSRRHNFYLLDELLDNYEYTESEIRDHCSGVRMLELTLAELQRQMEVPYFNQMVSVPVRIRTLPKNAKIKFVPLCNQLRTLLGIEILNLDD